MGINMGMRTESLQITPEILRLIAEIDEFKGAWRALGQLILPSNFVAIHFRRALIHSMLL